MSDQEHLEDHVRRSLRAQAEGIVVDDQDFDPTQTSLADIPDADLTRTRRVPRLLLVAAVVGAVLVAAGVIALQSGHSNDDGRAAEQPPSSTTPATTTTTRPSGPSQPAPAALVEQVTSIPESVLAHVGAGSNSDYSKPLPGPVLTDAGGKPRIVWIGAEYCPFCAAQRWPLVVALSRFGTFSGLHVTSSAVSTPVGSPEVLPGTQGFSFHGSTYTSDYVTFEPVETQTNAYKSLDTPTPEQQQLFEKYDAPPYVEANSVGAIPFVDFANTYLLSGASYDAALLQGRSRDDIAAALSDPSSDIAQGVDGTANVITALICRLTGDKPAAVCGTPTISNIEAALPTQP